MQDKKLNKKSPKELKLFKLEAKINTSPYFSKQSKVEYLEQAKRIFEGDNPNWQEEAERAMETLDNLEWEMEALHYLQTPQPPYKIAFFKAELEQVEEQQLAYMLAHAKKCQIKKAKIKWLRKVIEKHDKKPHPSTSNQQDIAFAAYLTDGGKRILLRLVETYTGKKAKDLVPMMFALHKMEMMPILPTEIHRAKLTAALCQTFQSSFVEPRDLINAYANPNDQKRAAKVLEHQTAIEKL